MASGGTPPYIYSTSNANVANVTSNSGLVTVRGNGTAYISVRDSSFPAQTRSYAVVVSNVVRCLDLGNGTVPTNRSVAANAGRRLPSLTEAREIHAAYGARWPIGGGYFDCTSTFSHSEWFSNYYYVINVKNGDTGTAKDHFLGGYSNAIGLL